MKEKDENLLAFGIFNAISVIPVLCLDILVTFVVFVVVLRFFWWRISVS